jgi:hypothetical protein
LPRFQTGIGETTTPVKITITALQFFYGRKFRIFQKFFAGTKMGRNWAGKAGFEREGGLDWEVTMTLKGMANWLI